MLRELMVNEGHIAPAGYAATTNCKTGMGVQISHSTGKFAFPSAESATNIFVVKKERYPSGVNAANTQFSDYDEDFNTVKAGEYAPLCNYYAGESFATDQYGSTVKEENVGKYVAVGADGKWTVAGNSTSSVYLLTEMVTDNGHVLARITVQDTAGKNS